MARFHLFNTMHGETIACVEMDETLLKEEVGIVDPETLTLRPIKNGGVYTLMPMDDHTVATLRIVRESYNELVKRPAAILSGYISRMDALVTAVGLLFKEIEYIVVEGPDDLDKLINPPQEEYTPKTVKYDILGDILKDVEDDFEVVDAIEEDA